MTAAFSARRSADEFDALLSRGPDAPLTEREAAQFAALLAVVADLRAFPGRPAAEFVSSLRERLMAEADTALLRQPAAPQRLGLPVADPPAATAASPPCSAAPPSSARPPRWPSPPRRPAGPVALPRQARHRVRRRSGLAGDDAAAVARSSPRPAPGSPSSRSSPRRRRHRAAHPRHPRRLHRAVRRGRAQPAGGVRAPSGSDADIQAAREFTATSMDRLDALQCRAARRGARRAARGRRTLTDLDLEISSACGLCPGG